MQNEKGKNETKRPFYENIDKLKSFSYAVLSLISYHFYKLKHVTI